MKIDQLA